MNLLDLDYVNIYKVIKRNTAEILEEDESGIFVFDKKSEIFIIACDDTNKGLSWVDKHYKGNYLINVCVNEELANIIFKKYNKRIMKTCYQVVYLKKELLELDDKYPIRDATMDDKQFILDNYHILDDEEINRIIENKEIFMIEKDGDVAGFIGEHGEGSMGMLFIKEDYRKLGLATNLEKFMINKTIEEGYIPFGHIVDDNYKSLNLQKKLGLEIAPGFNYWII